LNQGFVHLAVSHLAVAVVKRAETRGHKLMIASLITESSIKASETGCIRNINSKKNLRCTRYGRPKFLERLPNCKTADNVDMNLPKKHRSHE